jgi:hypothetical protein
VGKDKKSPKNPKASKGSSLGPFGWAWGQDKNGRGSNKGGKK